MQAVLMILVDAAFWFVMLDFLPHMLKGPLRMLERLVLNTNCSLFCLLACDGGFQVGA